MKLAYTVDSLDRIIAIDGPWDEFARANGAPALTRGNVLGRSLFDYIDGIEAAELSALLLERARKSSVAPIPFRGDSPTHRRFLSLALRADPKGRVHCESTIEREEERAFQPLLDAAAARKGGIVVICSWCKKVRLPAAGPWVEVEEAAGPLDLFGVSPQISHGLCEPCLEMVRASTA